MTECPQGHEIRTQADRTAQGYCRECKREDERRRRRFTKTATDIVKMFQEGGVVFFDPDDGALLSYGQIVAQINATITDEQLAKVSDTGELPTGSVLSGTVCARIMAAD
ncbi:hypothetical protein [Mycolicibacterium llatzerense]|uniref:hypothetical protein n=1 Tax=Mycolicibacterium llatzerense TaxID=280871 RepID=UPI0008DDBB66|nr:hypothetical protein [Mycolicibacterium llatzerense]